MIPQPVEKMETMLDIGEFNHTPHFTLYSLHLTLCTLHSALHTSNSTLYAPHSSLQTLHSTVHTLHSPLYTSHSILHTPHCTLLTPHSTPHTPHSPQKKPTNPNAVTDNKCEKRFLNNLVHLKKNCPVTLAVERVGVPSVEREESGLLSGECNVNSVKWGLWSVECKV